MAAGPYRVWFLSLVALLAAAVAVSLSVGAVNVPPSEVLTVLARRLGLTVDVAAERADAVVWSIRLPRVLMGVTAGAALGVTGASLQGLFRNRLADPQLVGIAPGAAVGGAIAINTWGSTGAIIGGMAAGTATALVLQRLARRQLGRPSRFILTGVALGAALSAWVGFAVFAGDRSRVPAVDFWLLGTLSGSTWRALAWSAVGVAAGIGVLLPSARRLDLLSLGDVEARHLGLDVARFTPVALVAIGIAVGAVVGAVGVIGFVGLLVPHVMRVITGPSHARLLVASAVGGAIFVVAADLAARTLTSPIEIPIGLITAAVGGPFFLFLLTRGGQ